MIDPLRLLDCSYPVDTAVAVIMTRADRARDLAQPPVRVLSFQGLHAGPNEFIFGQPGLGINQLDVFDLPPAGGDAAGLPPRRDRRPATSTRCTAMTASRRRCSGRSSGSASARPARPPTAMQDGRIGLGGELPVNTSGGHLSEGHSNGWGQTLEIVRQLRGQAGPRQIEDSRASRSGRRRSGDSILYGRDDD